MLVSRGVIGSIDSAEGITGKLDFLEVPWADAAKRLLRQRTKGGLDFGLFMQEFQYLFHGAILFRDQEHTVVVRRPEEMALIIDLGETSSGRNLVRQAVLIGHAFGNQHMPIEVDGQKIIVPMLTSEGVMIKTVRELHLGELQLRFDRVRLGEARPLVTTRHTHE